MTKRNGGARAVLAGIAVALGLSAAAAAQDLGVKAAPQAMPTAIVNATIHPVDGPEIATGYVLFDAGVIVEVGPMGDGRAFAANIRQVDGSGKHVYPSMITPFSRLGLAEIVTVRAMMDVNEAGNVSPEAYAAVSVNPDSTLLPVARANGVLVAGVFPGGGTVPGRASVIRLDGWTWEDMAVKRHAGVVVQWPNVRVVTAWWMDQSEEEQRRGITQSLERIRDTFKAARAYIKERDARPADVPVDLRWEAMRDVLEKDAAKRAPVFVEAADYDQITSAVAFGQEEGLSVVIVGGRDAPLCAGLLKERDVPVIFTSVMDLPRRDDSAYDENYSGPAKLHAAGVKFCIASGEETPHERNLPYAAAMAAAHGLDRAQAVRAVTLSAAEILGVSETLGSIRAGKEATLIVTTGDPLEVTTQTTMAFVRGREIDLSTKQSALAAKYREKYRQVREGAGNQPNGADQAPNR
jgi:imidazolonepropionase-like amidohydrolase